MESRKQPPLERNGTAHEERNRKLGDKEGGKASQVRTACMAGVFKTAGQRSTIPLDL